MSPTKPDYLTITPEEREQAKAEAARKQQQMLAAFEAGQAAHRLHRLDALVDAWLACTAGERLRFLRDFVDAGERNSKR